MEKKAVRVAYGEALVKLGESNDKVVVLDADLAAATMTNAFKKAFPDLEAVRDYVEHDAEKTGDPTEGNAYLELEHGRYWLRLITRKGDYNLYLHVLSKAAMAGNANG